MGVLFEVPQALAGEKPWDPLGGRWANLGEILRGAANLVLGVGLSLVFIFIVVGGIRYVTAAGDPKAMEAARGTIMSAVLGLLVIGGAYVIINLVLNLLGGTLPGIFPTF